MARKEIKAELAATKKTATKHRREIADLKRQLRDQVKRIVVLERGDKKSKPAESNVDAASVRFSPKWVRTHRDKLELTRADYAALVGVSAQTIYNWESGTARPGAKQLTAWGAVRALGKREAWKLLEEME